MRRHSARTGPRLALLAALALAGPALLGCSPIERRHGYAPDDATLALIDVGVDTRESVARKIGEPGSTGVLAGGDFYYVADLRRTFGPRPTVIADRQVVTVRFDAAGRVANVERFGLERGRVVPLSRRVTDANVQGIGILRQLFGTLGQIRAEDVVGE